MDKNKKRISTILLASTIVLNMAGCQRQEKTVDDFIDDYKIISEYDNRSNEINKYYVILYNDKDNWKLLGTFDNYEDAKALLDETVEEKVTYENKYYYRKYIPIAGTGIIVIIIVANSIAYNIELKEMYDTSYTKKKTKNK